jgi:hypothetical protein
MGVMVFAGIGLFVMLGIAGLIILACMFVTSEPMITLLAWALLAFMVWVIFF